LISDLDAAESVCVDVAKTQLRSGLRRDSFADALEFQNTLLDYEDGILKVGCAG
jgi:hypothetical protein